MDEWEVGQYASILHNDGETLELPFNSAGGVVRSWLFCKQNFPCLVRFLCVLGVGVEVWTNNFLCQFTTGQTHFVLSRGVKGVLATGERFPLVECNTNTNSLNKKVSMSKSCDFLEFKPISKLLLMTLTRRKIMIWINLDILIYTKCISKFNERWHVDIYNHFLYH